MDSFNGIINNLINFKIKMNNSSIIKAIKSCFCTSSLIYYLGIVAATVKHPSKIINPIQIIV
jgi:hypothetical protein